MLHNGIYEQVINKALDRELAATDKLSQTAPIDAAEAAKVLAKYVAAVVEKGLENVQDNGGDVNSQVELVNRIVSTIIAETSEVGFDELSVAERAEQLLALLDRQNSMLALDEKAEIVRPVTSIAQSSLFTGAVHEPQMYIRLEGALKSVTNIKAKLILFWVELHRHTRKESDLYDTPLNYAYELEHIMPQKWVGHWGLDVLPILDENGEPLPTDVAARKRGAAIYEIGNMTLLSSRLNKELQNYSFKEKVEGAVISKKQRFGMRQYASLSITKEVIQRDPLVWSESQIYERTARLSEEVKEIWPCTAH